MGDEDGFEQDGVWWQGSREDLEDWIEYKRSKATHFVECGYSVSWLPDPGPFMEVYVPERPHLRKPEYRAYAQFYRATSQYGIGGGAVSKLNIRKVHRGSPFHELLGVRPTIDVLFNYDRGQDVNKLARDQEAKRLYEIVIRELNWPGK